MGGTMITVVDYGAGNLGSVERALSELGAKVVISSSPEQVAGAERLLLPGVGSFAAAMQALRDQKLDQAILQFAASGRHFLGICLGMQLMASLGEENGITIGLGLVPGQVKRLTGALKIPHVGWNQVQLPSDPGPLFRGIPDHSWFYFAHSYYFQPVAGACQEASTEHDQWFPSALWCGSLSGVQFHPEMSGPWGRRLLQNFIDWRE